MKDSKLSIIYVGQLWQGGTCLMRMQALESQGHTIFPLDTSCKHISLLYRVFNKVGYPPDINNVNQKLLEHVKKKRPDIVWIDKGTIVRKKTLVSIKKNYPQTSLVHYNPDDPFGGYGKSGWRTFLKALPLYDVHFVPRAENVNEYKQRSAKNVYFLLPTRGFDPAVHYPRKITAVEREEYGGDVGFIGSYEQDRAEKILALADSGIKIRIWSAENWPKHKNIQHDSEGIYGDNYSLGLNSFKIILAFLRNNNRDKHTSRSIEIPACGAFMLAERTDEHLQLFEEGKEAEFFGTTQELIDKVKFYLTQDELRRQIAYAGRTRCLTSGYDYDFRIKKMLSRVNEVCSS